MAERIALIDLGSSCTKWGSYTNGELSMHEGAFVLDEDVCALAISGHGPSLVAIDEQGNILFYSPWYDRDYDEEVAYFEILTGQEWDGQYFLPKLMAFRESNPEDFARIRWVLGEYEYLAYHLTGKASIVLPSEDWQQAFWTSEFIEILNMPEEIFPPFVAPGTYLGETLPQSERPVYEVPKTFGLYASDLQKNQQAKGVEELRVPAGIPVALSGPDFITAIVGTDTMAAGRACLRAGSSYGLNVCSNRAVQIEGAFSKRHLVEGLSTISAVFSAGGNMLAWARETFVPEMPFERFIAELEHVDSRGVRVDVAWGGTRFPDWDPDRISRFSGVRADTTRMELAKAVLLGIEEQVFRAYEVFRGQGIRIDSIRVTGGMDIAWLNAYREERLGVPVISSGGNSAELLGSAKLAMQALGL